MRTYTVTEYEKEDYENLRENITNDEVLEMLEEIERGLIPDYNFDNTERDFENYKLHLALYKAMDAIRSLN